MEQEIVQPTVAEVPISSEAAPEPKQPNVLEQASFVFGMNIPKFCAIVDKLSNKSLRRVMRAIVAQPLEDLSPNLKNENEKAAYQLGEMLMQAKMVLVMQVMLEQQQKNQEIVDNVNQEPKQEQENSNVQV